MQARDIGVSEPTKTSCGRGCNWCMYRPLLDGCSLPGIASHRMNLDMYRLLVFSNVFSKSLKAPAFDQVFSP